MNQNNQLIKVRREKLDKIISMGINPFPPRAKRTHKIIELLENKETFIESNETVYITGRINAHRRQGKIGFTNLLDMSGKIQVFVKKDKLGDDNYDLYKLLDLGDFIQVKGQVIYTQTGEFSLLADEIVLLSKNLRPLPTVKEKEVDGKLVRYDEFADIELRYRKRYLDLLLNPEHRYVFELRSKIFSHIRQFLDGREFLEVETPVLQPLYGGANARPFTTHHNTLDVDLYLRIATELYLKRIVIGGFERVYEIGKNFRNEGMDRTHNPEFTLIEIYQTYTDLDGMIELTESLFQSIAKNIFNQEEFQFGEYIINLKNSFKKASMLDLIKEHTGQDFSDFDLDKLRTYLDSKKIEYDKNVGAGKLIAEVFDNFVESKLIQPTFVIDYPLEISPLAKNHPDNPQLVERFELFIAGKEFGNAFTELNNPLEQRRRLEAQAKAREMGDDEANVVDEDFIEALEYGMPPMGGLGIGLDRLVMLFTNNSSIKEVIFFPQMKSE
ncbi:MAG: lysine--tRNA ligase [Candidatus Cloacimonetes bacterium]|nr:lysine--tRNA ligase [Candidatus Cloacimonadota bacterium]